MKRVLLIALGLGLAFSPLLKAAEEKDNDNDHFQFGDFTSKGIRRGPLQISAEETTSHDRAKIIDAKGHVKMHYDMESGDVLESYSKYAHYDGVKKTGEIYGHPRAIWKSVDPKQPETLLTADKIFMQTEEESLSAYGNVVVTRSSSTLHAQEMHYLNSQKKLTAFGGRPVFEIWQPQHHTRIVSDQVIAWTDRKEIHFN